jgi:hypothetical protein
MTKFAHRVALFVAVLLGALALTGCGSGGATTAATSAATAPVRATANAQPAPVRLHLSEGSHSVSAHGTTISGTASKGAAVSVDGRPLKLRAGHWRDRLRLHLGTNQVAVEATIGGHAPARRVIHIVRHRSAGELEALARARALRAEAERRHAAEVRRRRERAAQERAERERSQQQAACPNGTYENSAGNVVCKPYESPTQPAGATARCEDGTYSFSESRSGTCSHHGGVAAWLNG